MVNSSCGNFIFSGFRSQVSSSLSSRGDAVRHRYLDHREFSKGYPDHRTVATRYESDLLGLYARAITPRRRICAQPQRDVGGRQRLRYHPYEVIFECLQIRRYRESLFSQSYPVPSLLLSQP